MEFILQNIEKCLYNKLYFVALQSTLTLPDICGALESETGSTNGKSYKKWYDENMQGKSILSAEDCYAFRNGMVHQAYPKHKNMRYERVIFIHPDFTNIIGGDNNIINNAVWIDFIKFCENMIESVRQWEKRMKDSNNVNFEKNYSNLIQVHPKGISPYIVGIPVIG